LSGTFAISVPEAEVTWFKNKVKLHSAHQLHDGSLLIANVSLSDQGLYSCKAANLRGEVTESTQLLVLEPPQPLPHLEDLTAVFSTTGTTIPSVLTSTSGTKMTISPGSSVLIGCAVNGHPTPNITWLFAGEPLNLKHHVLAAGHILQVLNVSDAMEGEFSCLAENEAGSLTQKTSLTIQGNFLSLHVTQSGLHLLPMQCDPEPLFPFCLQPVDGVYGYVWELRLPVSACGMCAHPHQQTCAGPLLLLETTACKLATLQHHTL
uniref:Ig-like domain-containing protein n=1 Tax=Apteryx owenii TaxID=8824 RepID=A0A8B9PJ85_APTOW